MHDGAERDGEALKEHSGMPSVEQLLGLTDADIEAKAVYRIGDLAAEFGVTMQSLRFYEQRGLLSPERRGVTRLYSPDDHRRLRLILLCKTLGFSLAEIHQIVGTYFGGTRSQQRSKGLKVAFERQRSVLQAQREDLNASLTALDVSIVALGEPSSRKR